MILQLQDSEIDYIFKKDQSLSKLMEKVILNKKALRKWIKVNNQCLLSFNRSSETWFITDLNHNEIADNLKLEGVEKFLM